MDLADLDIQTVMILLFFGNLIAVFVLAAYRSGSGKTRPYYQFLAGKILQAIGWLLLILRSDIPDILSISVSNSILIAGLTLETSAITNSERQYRYSEQIFGILAGVSILVFWLFQAAPPNTRITIISFATSIIYLACMTFLIVHHQKSRIRRVIGILFMVFSIILLIRGEISFWSTSSDFTLYTQSIIQSLAFFAQFLSMLVSGIGFILLLKESDDQILLKNNEEQARLIEALQESEAFNRGLVENLPDYIVVYDPNGRILYTNPAISETLGYQQEEMRGLPLLSLITVEHQEGVKDAMRDRLKGNSLLGYETNIQMKDGGTRSVIVKGTNIQYQGFQAVLLLLVDITKRKEIEQAMIDNEAKFVSIFEGTPDPILITNSGYRIIEVNQGFEKLFNHNNKEILGMNLDSLETGLTSQALDQMIRDGGSQQMVYHGKMNLVKEKGIPFSADVLVSRIAINSHPSLLIEIHDIDEILRANQAITEANHKLTILSSITRHDILNRIMITSFYTERIRETNTDETTIKQLNIISKATEEIQNIIDFTSQYQELGSTAPDWQRLETVFTTISRKILISKVEIQVRVDDVEIYADKMLQKVLYNLLENSFRHGVNLTRITLSCHEESGDLVIWYEDDGGGIPTEEKEKVFDKGFGKNTGLGLFLIREILSITGIVIRETGEPGKGVRFEILVPAGRFRYIPK